MDDNIFEDILDRARIIQKIEILIGMIIPEECVEGVISNVRLLQSHAENLQKYAL